MKYKAQLKSVTYTLISNTVSLIISALITLVVPRQLGAESYGYFQLYLFYVSYTGFLHFGWADGVLLRYGGQYYDKLDKPLFSGQFWLYSNMELGFGLLILLFGAIFCPEADKAIVIQLTGVAVILLLPRTLLQYILQGTNRIKEYAILTVLEKVTNMTVVIVMLLIGVQSYIPLVFADLLGKSAALIFGAYQCRDFIVSKPVGLKISIAEAIANISVGVKLMFANIASTLIIGIVRLSIESQWDVTTFGKVSLTMSVSNLLMVFINAIALVIFPLLRRTAPEKLSGIYDTMRTCLMLPLLGMLVLYYPMKLILSQWLPQYSDSLNYMALLFPMCVFESKMSMLVSTYMKSLRKEKWLLFVNLVTVSLSVMITAITVYWLHSLDLAIVSIVFLLGFRCILAESLISKVLKINVKPDIILEVILTLVFISASWLVGGIEGLLIYIAAYIIYLFIKRKSVMVVVKTILQLI